MSTFVYAVFDVSTVRELNADGLNSAVTNMKIHLPDGTTKLFTSPEGPNALVTGLNSLGSLIGNLLALLRLGNMLMVDISPREF
jgi:hypothetical protein